MSLQNPIEQSNHLKDTYDNSEKNRSLRHEFVAIREQTARGIGRVASIMYNLFTPAEKHETVMTHESAPLPDIELRPVNETLVPDDATPEELSFLLHEQTLADRLNMIDYAIRSDNENIIPTASELTNAPYIYITQEESDVLERETNLYLDSIAKATDGDEIREGIISLDSIYLLMRSMSYRKDDVRIKSALGTILDNLDDSNHRELIKPIRQAYETTGDRAIMSTYLEIIDNDEWNMDDITGETLPDDYVKQAFTKRGIQVPDGKLK